MESGLHTPLIEDGSGNGKGARSDCKLQEKCFLTEGQAQSRQQYNAVQRKLILACVLCFMFMVVEIVGGWIARSIAIMSDAAHMLSDVSAFLVSIFAAWAATQPGTQLYSFGYHRAEILGALVSVLIIWLVTGALVFEAVQRTIEPVRVDGKIMFIISLAGIVFNVLVALTLGVHAHLGGHSHDQGHGGCGGGHAHGGGHGSGHGHDHGDEEEGHAHAHGGGCGGGAAAAAAVPASAAAAAEAVVRACGGGEHMAQCKCFIKQTGPRDIEVRCELPPPGAAAPSTSGGPAAGAAAAGAGKRGGHGHGSGSCSGGGHSHGHGHGGGDSHGHGHGHSDNINLRGAVMHVIGDLVQSVGVAIAGGLIWLHQDDPRWYIADPICTFLFSVLVLWTTKGIITDIFAVLMERAPRSVNPAQVSDALSRAAGVLDVHDLHVWNISTGIPVLTAHVHIGEDADPNAVLSALEGYVRGFGIRHSTIQICNPAAGGSGSGSGSGSDAGGSGGHGRGHGHSHEHGGGGGGCSGHGHSH